MESVLTFLFSTQCFIEMMAAVLGCFEYIQSEFLEIDTIYANIYPFAPKTKWFPVNIPTN